jgi:hypothetical protein
MGKNYNPNMDYFPFACGALQKMKLLLGGGPDLRITPYTNRAVIAQRIGNGHARTSWGSSL